MAFNEQAYLAANPDVAAAGMNALAHYNQYGQAEGRSLGTPTQQPTNLGMQQNQMMPSQSTGATNPIANYLSQALGSGADYFRSPYEYEGQQGNARLGRFATSQVLDMVNQGMDYNTAVIRVSGDGIGTGAEGSTFDLGMGGMPGGGFYGGGSQSGGSSSGGLNPYLTAAQQALTSQVTDNLNRNILPRLSSAAVASGNFGGSRQGVIEANALNDANRQIANGMANLSFQAYESDANRGLQQQQIDNSYNLGMGNLGLGQMTATNNFYTAQRGQDLQSTALGAQLMNQGNQGYLNQGQGLYNLGATYQSAPWQVVGSYSNTLSPWGQQTGSSTGSQSSNPWASALGGAMGGAQLGKLLG